jgi:hypothetical protein
LKQFHELHQYVRLIGEHINQIHTRLDTIDRAIHDMMTEHKMFIETNKTELERIKEIIVSKSEVKRLLQELNNSFKGGLPELPETEPAEPEVEEPEVPESEPEEAEPEEPEKEEADIPEPESEEPEKEEAYLEEKWEMEKPRTDGKKRRFPFLPRF